MLGMQVPFCGRLEALFQNHFTKTASKSICCRQLAGGISGFLDIFCTVALLTTGAILTALGQITPGTVAAMFGYFGVCSTIIGKGKELIQNLPVIQNSRDRMLFFYSDPENPSGKVLPTVVDSIAITGLTFQIDDKTVPAPISFQIRKGEKIVLTGPNGCGKSTILQLLTGLWRDYGGSIRLASCELRDVAPASWRAKFAYAPQDPVIFAGTVRDNILPGGDRETVDALLAALHLDTLADRQLPYGGCGLSGGEKQKISIARAIAKNTPILILDEPGNDLDKETLAWLSNYLHRIDKTVLYVSHDPLLIKAADRQVEIHI